MAARAAAGAARRRRPDRRAACWCFSGETPLAAGAVAAAAGARRRGDLRARGRSLSPRTATASTRSRPGAAEDYDALLGALAEHGRPPARSRCTSGTSARTPAASLADVARARDLAFYSLLGSRRRSGSEDWSHAAAPAGGLERHAGGGGRGRPAPLRALLLGPCRVIPREFPNLHCRSIDVALPAPGSRRREARLARQLLARAARADAPMPRVALPRPRAPGRSASSRCRLDRSRPERAAAAPARRVSGDRRSRRPRPRARAAPGDARAGAPGAGRAQRAPAARSLAALARRRIPRTTAPAAACARSLRIEAAGGEVMTASADVQDPAQLRAVVRGGAGALRRAPRRDPRGRRARRRPDPVQDGGVGASACSRPRCTARSCSTPRWPARPLDFLLLFSSLSRARGPRPDRSTTPRRTPSSTPSPGTAARAKPRPRSRSAGAPGRRSASPPSSRGRLAASRRRSCAAPGHAPVPGALPARRTRAAALRHRASTRRRHWLLDEHRTQAGTALIPGTGYLELARAALATAARARRDRDPRHVPDAALRRSGRRAAGAAPRARPLERRFRDHERRDAARRAARAEHVRGTIALDGRADRPTRSRWRICARAAGNGRETHEGHDAPGAPALRTPLGERAQDRFRARRGARRARAARALRLRSRGATRCTRRCSTWRPAARTR